MNSSSSPFDAELHISGDNGSWYGTTIMNTDYYGGETYLIELNLNKGAILAANTPPTINGATNATITVGTTFDPKKNVTATDKEDGDLTSKIIITGTINTTKPGTYKFIYKVTDSDGATTTTTRTITVIDNTYTLTFNLNHAPGTPPTQQKLTGTVTKKPADPIWSGHRFDGWYTASTGGTEFEFGKTLTADTTVYAHWTPVATAMPETGNTGTMIGSSISMLAVLTGLVIVRRRRS